MIEAGRSKSFAAERIRERTSKVRWEASPLTWLNLVGLDAPLVAIGWQLLFARGVGASPDSGATTALFLTAWLIYLADRFGDSLSIDLTRATALRQRFCVRYRKQWLIVIAAVAAADIAAICLSLRRPQLSLGAAIGFCAIAYLVVNRVRPKVWRVAPLKEISIGFIFAAGTMVPLAERLTTATLPAWLLFACLCAINCICIANWERYLDIAQQRISIATAFPALSRTAAIVGSVMVIAGASFAVSDASQLRLYAAIGASAVLLILLHASGRRISQDARTALADIALLTPFVSLVI